MTFVVYTFHMDLEHGEMNDHQWSMTNISWWIEIDTYELECRFVRTFGNLEGPHGQCSEFCRCRQ